MAKAQPCCKECGGDLPPAKPNAPHQRFCSAPCRKGFNNRRATRGSMLIDLMMTDYVDRNHPRRKSGELQKAVRRLLSRWRDEDVVAGREHCNDPELILADMSLTMNFIYADGGNPWSGASKAAKSKSKPT